MPQVRRRNLRDVEHLPYKERIKRELCTHSRSGIELYELKGSEGWGHNGEPSRFHPIYNIFLNREPTNFLISLKKKNPKIMILGAGKGEDIPLFKKELQQNKINPIFDVFSLTNSLSPKIKRNIVRNDFSNKLGFEQINPQTEEHKILINKIKGKYDLVVASLSVGVYTKYPSTTLLNAGMLLSKGGRAYIEVSLAFLEARLDKKSINYSWKLNNKYNLLFNKFVDTINKKENTDYKFRLSMVNGVTVLIERLN